MVVHAHAGGECGLGYTYADPMRGFARGFSIQTVGPLPIEHAMHVLGHGHWGQALREYMRDYNHWYTLGILSELLPLADNRVTVVPTVTDQNGIPVARMDYSQCDNDRETSRSPSRRCTTSSRPAGRRTYWSPTATRTSSAAAGWAPTPSAAWSTRVTARGRCRTCSSPTEA